MTNGSMTNGSMTDGSMTDGSMTDGSMTNGLFGTMIPSMAAAMIIVLSSPSTGLTQPVMERLSGFDEPRIKAIADWVDQPLESSDSLAREAAKLLYQVNRLDRGGTLAADTPAIGHTTPAVGHLARIRGSAAQIDSWALPESLADVLDFKVVYRVKVTEPESSQSLIVITSEIPQAWTAASPAKSAVHETSATGVWLRLADESRPGVIASPRLSWLATLASDVPKDWALLGERGFDVSLFEGVRRRDRQRLQSEDAEAFYGLLRIAASLDEPTLSDGTAVAPSPEPAAELLKRSRDMVGRFVEVDVKTVRVTRIRTTAASTIERLGGDHYWQLDAIGDLGNVIIRIESEGAQPAMFEHRYPLSIAVRELPPFLAQQMADQNGFDVASTDTALVSSAVTVAGFFYRLWSYDSDYMAQHGGGDQFGPLIIASRIRDHQPTPGGESSGVWRIGWLVAGLALLAVLAAMVGGAITARRDKRAKHRQRSGLPERIVD